MKAISFSLFGYNEERKHNCYDFESYCRSFHINMRLNRLIYPDFISVLNIDHNTYNSPYKPIFDWHVSKGWLLLNFCPSDDKLCKKMLWRLKTVFMYEHPEWKFSHILCRDVDSIPTYRGAQMVAEWIKEDRTMHCITDSISHNISAMGGLIGFRPGYLADRLNLNTTPERMWDKLLSLAPDINYNVKGSDQDFLNRIVYPKCATHCTEHYIKGKAHDMPEGNGRHYQVPNITLPINPAFQETNLLCGHEGSSGFYEAPTMKFLRETDPFNNEYYDIETAKEFDKIFYWRYREDL